MSALKLFFFLNFLANLNVFAQADQAQAPATIEIQILPPVASIDGVMVTKIWDDEAAISALAQDIAAKSPHTGKAHEEYNNFVNEKWKRLDELSIAGAIAFEQRELAHLEDTDGAQVFYPFGGPDMVYPLILFPSAGNYILVGLEPVGKIDDAKKPLEYSKLKGIMGNIFNSGFFVTDKMNRNLKNFGTLPVLLGLIAKMNYIPTKVEEIKLKDLEGVRIYFKNEDGDEKNVAYYKGDLTAIDPKIFGNSQIAMIKCCSYFMHGGNVPLLKNYLAKDVRYLLQDDTGMPLRDLIKAKRKNIAYGSYSGPYGTDFPWAKQNDLITFYQNKDNVKELGFRIGYGFGKAPSNLMLSILDEDTTQEASQ